MMDYNSPTTRITSHTSGPWGVWKSNGMGPDGTVFVQVVAAVGGVICSLGYQTTTKDHMPDARLIAAAPDMLKALKGIARFLAPNGERKYQTIIGNSRVICHYDPEVDWVFDAIKRAEQP